MPMLQLRTAYSKEPVLFFVLDFSLLDAIRQGIGSTTTTDPSRFQKVLAKEIEKGTEIIYDKLPFGKRRKSKVVCSEDFPNSNSEVKRITLVELIALSNAT